MADWRDKLAEFGERPRDVWPLSTTPSSWINRKDPHYVKEGSIYQGGPSLDPIAGAITTDKVLSQLAGKGKPSLIHSHTADVLADYIKKLPENIFKRIDNIRWRKFKPSSRAKGHYIPELNVAEINTMPYRKELYSPMELEGVGVKAADTLFHETAHGKVYTDLDDKEYWLRNLMANYHDDLYKKKNYMSKHYWDDPMEVHARNVAARSIAKPQNYGDIYKNELYKSIAGIPADKIIDYTKRSGKDVDKYLNLKEAVVDRLMEKRQGTEDVLGNLYLSNYKLQP